jgi:hypothetical protein
MRKVADSLADYIEVEGINKRQGARSVLETLRPFLLPCRTHHQGVGGDRTCYTAIAHAIDLRNPYTIDFRESVRQGETACPACKLRLAFDRLALEHGAPVAGPARTL